MDINTVDGATMKTYIYADSQILAQHDGNSSDPRYFYLHDRLGSVRLLIDDEGVAQNSYTYDPFGESFDTECTENVSNPFKFTGQFYDSEIDQYYLRARMYDPQLMRFTARDPVQGGYQEPLTLHKYLYCASDPINRIDLNGAYWDGPWWAQREFWTDMWNEAVKGAAATADGFIPLPFVHPFEKVYANPDGSVDRIYRGSRLLGSVGRTALLFALDTWMVETLLVSAPGPGGPIGATWVEKVLIGSLWKTVGIANTLGNTAGITWGAGTTLLDIAGAADNIVDVLGFLDE